MTKAARRRAPWALLPFAAALGCAGSRAAGPSPPRASAAFARPPASAPARAPSVGPPPQLASASRGALPDACRSDADCGYDPRADRCGSAATHNRQPPIVDQGILCYCDGVSRTCATLRVLPVPCEGDADCGVRYDPRPHPVRASAEHPHDAPAPACAEGPGHAACSGTRYTTTCERTNICTMHRRERSP